MLDARAAGDLALSAGSRKKLRQHRRRLAQAGALAYTTVVEYPAVRAAFEDFLRIEASGWKGRQNTALLCSAADAAFARGMVAALAERDEVAIHALTLDGRPVSMQVVLRAGATAFTWKTTYDERLQDYSPGMLLFEDYTAAFRADQSIARVDSCSFDDTGFMAAWKDRMPIASMLIDARRGRSAAFAVEVALQKRYLRLRGLAKAAAARGPIASAVAALRALAGRRFFATTHRAARDTGN